MNGMTLNQFKTAVLNEVVQVKTINGEVAVELTELDWYLDFADGELVLDYSANTEAMLLSGSVGHGFDEVLDDDYLFDSKRIKDLMKLILSDIQSQLNNEEQIVNAKALFKQTAYEI